jgi:hypothetical protein
MFICYKGLRLVMTLSFTSLSSVIISIASDFIMLQYKTYYLSHCFQKVTSCTSRSNEDEQRSSGSEDLIIIITAAGFPPDGVAVRNDLATRWWQSRKRQYDLAECTTTATSHNFHPISIQCSPLFINVQS